MMIFNNVYVNIAHILKIEFFSYNRGDIIPESTGGISAARKFEEDTHRLHIWFTGTGEIMSRTYNVSSYSRGLEIMEEISERMEKNNYK